MMRRTQASQLGDIYTKGGGGDVLMCQGLRGNVGLSIRR